MNGLWAKSGRTVQLAPDAETGDTAISKLLKVVDEIATAPPPAHEKE
jgi:hypothetical protein